MDSEDEDDVLAMPINSPASKSLPTRGCFINAGNTCFIGATLQLLLHVPNVTSLLGRFEKGAVASALHTLNELHQQSRLIFPGPILQVMDKIAPNFKKNEQQDAHEFLVLLLETLIKEAGTIVTPVHYLFSSAIAELVSCEKCYRTSSVQNIFPTIVTVKFHGFSEVEEALSQGLQPESLDCSCDDCGHDKKKKVSCLLMPANLLCLHIPRFTRDENGNYGKSFSELLISKSLTYSGHKYNLISLIVHHGASRSNGHYTAFCLDRTNVWYHFSDSKSAPVNILSYLDSKECLQNAYIALYEKEKAAGVEVPLESLSQLMSKSSVSNRCDPPTTRGPRRKLMPDQIEENIPPKKMKIADSKTIPNQCESLQPATKTTTSVSTQTYPIWSYEGMSMGDKDIFKYFPGVTPGEFEVIYDMLGGDPICSKLKYNYDDQTPLRNSHTIKISLKSRLFLVLLRMRRGLSLQDIGELMQLSHSHCAAIFYTRVRLLAITFKRLSKFMLVSAKRQNEKKPTCFLPFKDLKIVIDCAEFQIERSTHMQQQGNCYSDYKHYTSGKVCVCISSYGGISYVSDVYEGRISDKKLVLDSGLLDQLEKGDVIMADRGFKLEEECLKRGLILLKPPEMSGGRQHLSPREEVITKSIACVRIYVEHVIGRIKDWKILQHRIELLLLPNLPDMIIIASFIHNFSKSYIK